MFDDEYLLLEGVPGSVAWLRGGVVTKAGAVNTSALLSPAFAASPGPNASHTWLGGGATAALYATCCGGRRLVIPLRLSAPGYVPENATAAFAVEVLGAAGGGAAGGGAAAGRALLLVQADLLLIFSVSKLRVRVDADASDSAGRPPCMHCDCQRSWTHDGVRTPRHASSLSVGGHVESSCKCIFTCRLPCILAPLRKACMSKASAQLVWRQQHGAHSPKHATELTAARAGHAGGGRGRRTERRRAGPLCTACGGGAAGYGAAGAG